ncbi:Myosin-3 [Rhizoctonia solani]|uniref:Myosin-3 n=1 Tax=Rhizoctonia solani TaxID=456999 RepID=A0A0K6G977_9AGAM|nr:Myosin-3 [Rhizoctonia solani]
MNMANASNSRFTSRVQQQTASLIRAIERIHEEESGIFITRADNISRENDRLRKELFDFQQRIKLLTERLGFENLDSAEESLNDKLAGVIQEHKVAVGKISGLTSELESTKVQLAQEQAARAEEQQLTESLRSDLARRKQAILDAQSESEQDREALRRLKLELQSEWQKSGKLESQISTYRKENERLTSECEELKSALAKDRVQRLSLAPETPLRGPAGVHPTGADLSVSGDQHPSGLDDISSLPLDVQIAHLRRQYDELLSSKERLSEKYAKDLADWAMFKEKYRGSSGGKGIVVSESGIKTRRRIAKQAKDSPTPAARISHPRMVPVTPADDDVFIKQEGSSLAPGALPPLQRLQLNPPNSEPATSEGVTPATSNTETQDSQSVTPAVRVDVQRSKGLEVTTSKPAGRKPPTRPDIAALKQGSQSDNEGSLILRKLSHANAPPLARSLSSPAESPHRPKDTPRRTKMLGKRKAFVFDGESTDDEEAVSHQASGLVPAPMLQRVDQLRDEREAQLRALRRKSGPQAVADYQQFKGRGRYAVASKAGDKTINSEFEINPAHNEGMAFEFDSVVRDKNERKKLTAGDCIACKEYYEAVGAMPIRPGAPLWRSPPPEGAGPSSRPHSCKHKGAGGIAPEPVDVDMDGGIDMVAHKQAISRHRHKWVPASTPPDYWNIGFPDTQQVEEINRRAGELHNQKRTAVEQEASREGGRYRKRAQ